MTTPVSHGDSVWLHFGTSSASTGAATNADSTPIVKVAEDGVDLVYAPTVTNVTTGLYKVQIDCLFANGFDAGKRYSIYVTAVVGGVTGRDGMGEFEIIDIDLNTGVASVTGAVASVTGLTAANLDVAVSTRLATAGYTAPDNASISTILADTNDIQSRLPAALVGGRIDASVGADAIGLATAANLATVNTMVLEIYRIHGLEVGTNLVVTALSRVAGAISQTIDSTSISGTTTVSRP